MRAIGIGDLHLPDHLGRGGLASYVENPELMILRMVRRVVDYAIENGIKVVIFYGDICENPRMSYESQEALCQLFDDYPDMDFHVLLGNHDLIGNDASLGDSLQLIRRFNKTSTNVKFYVEPTVVKFGKVKVNFLPFPHSKFRDDCLNVCHVDVYGAMSDSGREILDERRPKSDAVTVAGHIHTNHRVRNTYYSGTLYQTCFGEKLPKFFHLIEFNSPSDYEITNVPFKPEYRLHTLTVMDKEDIPSNLGKKDLVKLIIKDGANISPPDYAHLNVCKVQSYKNKQQLKAALSSDVPSNSEGITLSTKDFLSSWLNSQDVEPSMKKRVMSLRKRILEDV